MRIHALTLFVSLNIAQLVSSGQGIGPHPLYRNTLLLKVEMTTDKTSYLTGEEIEVTISVTNPTDRALQVIEPFKPNVGGVMSGTEYAPGKWTSNIDHPPEPCWSCPNLPVVTFLAHEVRKFSFRTGDPDCSIGEKLFILSRSCVPAEKAGRHGFYYLYGAQGRVEFEAVEAEVSEIQQVQHKRPLRRELRDNDGKAIGRTIDYPRLDLAMILKAGGRWFVAVTSQPHNSGSLSALKPGTVLVNLDAWRAGPYRLMDESSMEIKNLQFSTDEAENFAVSYERANEGRKILRLDSKRTPLAEKR